MEPAINLNDVVTLLGRFPALAGLSLSVHPGEVVLLQGPNGGGKTTTLGLCAGLLRVERGEARVLGVDLSDNRSAVRRRVGLLGHETGLYLDLTVAENVRFWAAAARAEAEQRPALELLGLAGRLSDVAVRRLSAGQRRRAALACLVVRRPELWLLDEPHAALDQEGRDRVDALIQGAVAAGGTVVLASHELDRVRSLQPRVVTLAGGLVVNDEPAATLGEPAGTAPTDRGPDVP